MALENLRAAAERAGIPTGLSQQAAGPAGSPAPPEQGGGLNNLLQRGQEWGLPAWQTGGRTGGTSNGFNTDFYDRMFKQQNEVVQSGRGDQWYDRDDFTGVAFYDRNGKRDVKYGDIYDGGVRVGNLYEDQNLNKEQADMLMGQLMLGEKVGRFKSPEELSKELQRQRKTYETDATHAAGAREFEERTEKQKKDWRRTGFDGWVDTFGAVTGTAGGAVTGASLGVRGGPVAGALGAIGGGVVGLFGSLANQDEAADQIARATVQTQLAAENGNIGSAVGSGLQNFGAYMLNRIDPIGNATRGIYDLSHGEVGDGEVSWYAVDPVTGESERGKDGWGWAWDTANVLGMVASGFGAGATKLGRNALMGAMGTSVGGGVTQLTLGGGETFDDRRGDFDNVYFDEDGRFDLGSSAAGVGAVGFDAVQMLGFKGLFNAADSTVRMFSRGADEAVESAKPGLWARLRDRANNTDRVEIGGFSYRLDSSGRAIEGSRRASAGLFAPSEMLQGATSSMMARMRARTTGSTGRPSADDYYQMSVSLSNGTRARSGILVNAIGEGYEEGMQAILEPLSHHSSFDMNEVMQSALMGAAFGGGLSAATTLNSIRGDKAMLAQANWIQEQLEKPTFDEKQWRSMTAEEKRAVVAMPDAYRESFKAAVENAAMDQKLDYASNTPNADKRYSDALKARAIAETKASAPKTDATLRITQSADARVPGNAVVGSIGRIEVMLRSHTEGLDLAVESETDPELKTQLAAAAVEARKLVEWAERSRVNFFAEKTLEGRREVITAMNNILKAFFDGTVTDVLPSEGSLARARAATIVHTRDPLDNAGSFAAFLPQVDQQLTEVNADQVLQIGLSSITPLGADFDGDKIRNAARLVMNETGFRAARQGFGALKLEGGVAMDATPHEEAFIINLGHSMSQGSASALHAAATSALASIKRRLMARYGKIEGFEEILDSGLRRFEQGDKKARGKLQEELSVRLSEPILKIDPLQITDEWQFLNRVIQQELQQFNGEVGGRIKPHGVNNAAVLPVIEPTSEGFTRRQAPGASEGATLAQTTQGSEQFRSFQKVQYVVVRTNIDAEAAANNPDLQRLMELFQLMNSNLSERALDQVQAQDEVLIRAQAKIAEFARQAGRPEAEIANMTMPNVDSTGRAYASKNSGEFISVAQWFLREEVLAAQSRFGDLLARDDVFSRRLEYLMSLTQPQDGRGKGQRGSALGNRAGAAFVELYQEVPLYNLVGTEALQFGADLTVGQYARTLFDKGWRARSTDRELLMMNPAYGDRRSSGNLPFSQQFIESHSAGNTLEYRSVVDSLLDYVDHRLSVTRADGKDVKAGEPRGELANRSNGVGKNLRESVALIQETLRSSTNTPLTRETVETFLRQNPSLDAAIYELINDTAALAFFRRDPKTGVLHTAPWLLDAFSMDPAKAELHILLNLTLATYNGKLAVAHNPEDTTKHGREYARLNDRLHRIYYHLASNDPTDTALDHFLKDVSELEDVADFERLINTKYLAESEPPFVAWVRDTAEFDATHVNGGWGEILDGASEREAIAALKSRASSLNKAIAQEQKLRIRESNAVGVLKDAYAAKQREELTDGSPLTMAWRRLELAVEAAKNTPPLVDPSLTKSAVMGSYRAFYEAATDKGKTARPFQGIGFFDSALESFGINYEATLASLESYDIDTLLNLPGLAARGKLRTTDHSGAPVTLPQLTPEFIVENLDNDAFRSYIYTLLTPSVWGFNEETKTITLQHLVEPSIADIIDPANEANTRLYSPDNAELYLTRLDGALRSNDDRRPLTDLISELGHAMINSLPRGLKGFSEEQLYTHVTRSVAKVIQALGDLTARRAPIVDPNTGEVTAVGLTTEVNGEVVPEYEAARRALGAALRSRFTDSLFPEIDEMMSNEAIREQLELTLVNARLAFVETKQKKGSLDTTTLTAQRDAALAQAVATGDVVGAAIEMYRFDPAQPNVDDVKRQLHAIVKMNPYLLQKAQWATSPLRKLLNAGGNMILDPITGLPALTDAEWLTISRVLSGLFIEHASGVPAGNQVQLPIFPDYTTEEGRAELRLWDPTYMAIIDQIFSKDIVSAAAELHRLSSRKQAMTLETFSNTLIREFLPEKKETDKTFRPMLGRWTADLPTLAKSASGRFVSAPAEPMIGQSGVAPKRQWHSIVWRRTFEKPVMDETTLASAQLSVSALLFGNETDYRFPVTHPDGRMSGATPASLNGRFAGGATITMPDGSVIDLWQATGAQRLGATWAYDPEGEHPEARAITLQQLQFAVKQATEKLSVEQQDKAIVTINYLHPDDIPLDQPNNAYYTGLVGENIFADAYPNATAGIWFAVDGLNRTSQQESLTASKTGDNAVMLAHMFTPDQRAQLELGWQRNFAKMLSYKTSAVMWADNGRGPMPGRLYNGVLLSIRRSHFVRGILKETGKPVLWTADQVIAWQRENRATSIDTVLDQAEIYVPSASVLRTLYGDRRDQASPVVLDAPIPLEYSNEPLYDGTVTERALMALPGILAQDESGAWKQLDAMDTILSNRVARPRYRGTSAQTTTLPQPHAERIRRNDALAESIRIARADTKDAQILRDSRAKASERLTRPATVGDNVIDWNRLGAAYVPTPAVWEQHMAKQLADQEASARDLGDFNQIWLLRENPRGEDVLDGVLSGDSLTKPKALAYSVSPRDYVGLLVDDYGDNLKLAMRRLDFLMERGVTIELVSPENRRNDVGILAQYIRENPLYRGVSRTQFVEDYGGSTPPNIRARETSLSVESTIEPNDLNLVLRPIDSFPMAENVAYVGPDSPASDMSNEVLIRYSMVPTHGYEDFAIPTDPRSIELVRGHIRGLLDPDAFEGGADFLAELAGVKTPDERAKWDRQLEELLRRWTERPDEDGMLPTGRMERGSIIPRIRRTANGVQVYLGRHGYEDPSRDKLEAMFAQDAGGDGPGSNIAVSLPKELGTEATVPEGEVVNYKRNNRFGLSAMLRVALRLFGGKVQIELGGFKATLAPKPEELALPKIAPLAGMQPNMIIDDASMNKKESNEGKFVSHRDVFGAIGIEFEEELVRFFTGIKRTDGERYATAVSRTRSLLSEMGRFLPKMSQRDLVEAQITRTLPLHVVSALGELRLRTADGVRDMDTLILELAEPSTLPSDEAITDATVAQAVIAYMLSPVDSGDARYTHIPAFERVMSTPGVHAQSSSTTRTVSQLMAPSFTQFFDELPYEHPARQHIRNKLQARMQSIAPDGSGYYLNPDFTVNVIPDANDPSKNFVAALQLIEAHSSGDNPTTDAISNARGTRQDNSETAQSLANLTTLGRIAVEKNRPMQELWDPRVHAVQNVQTFREMMQDVPEENPRARRFQLNPEERIYTRIASDISNDFRQPLETDYWKDGRSEAEYATALEQFNAKIAELTKKVGFHSRQADHFHYWIRQNLGMPKAPESAKAGTPEASAGRVSFEKAMDALAQIQYNLENGWLPTTDAEVPLIHHVDLSALYLGAEKKGGLQLRTDIDDPTRRAETWDEWISTALALGETKDNVFDPLFLTATDGMLQSYRNREKSLIGLPVTRDVLRQQKLYTEEAQQLALSLDPSRAETMNSPLLLQDRYAEFGSLFGAYHNGVRWQSDGASTRSRDQRRAARAKLREKGKIAFPVKTNIRNFAAYGSRWQKEQSTSTAVARMAMDLRVGTALINPLLWLSAAYELGIRSTLEAVSTAIAGGNLGTAAGKLSSKISDVTGIRFSAYTAEQQQKFAMLQKSLGTRPEFKGMLYSSLMYQPETGNFNILERGTKRLARIGSFMQDPTWGVKGTILARRYIEAVVQWRDAAGTTVNVSDAALINGLMSDPQWVEKNLPMAHTAALATIANNRSLKATPISLALQGIYEPLSNNPSALISTLGTLVLKVPMAFTGYVANFGTNVLGLQGPMAFIATHLHKRKIPGISSWLAGEDYDHDAEADMSRVIEGLDLSKAFIQSGMTHTLLFAAGMAAGGLGIATGGDEEERRRRRAAMYQRMPYAYDPRDIINDFRNAEPIYLDWLPFNLGGIFHIPNEEGTNSSPTMAQVPWYLRQFVSPILGMEKFFMTGDMRHITWGFQDAIGSMPLVNAQMWDDANKTIARLMESAPTEDDADQLDVAMETFRLGIQIISVYESMLFENSFINSVYVGSDQWDRDNWKVPLTDSDGVTQVDALKNPRSTTALQDTVDDVTGEMRQSTLSRNVWDATLHGFTEKRLTLALASMLFTGGTSLRQNQVVKTRTIDKGEIDQDAATAAVLGLYSNATGGAPEMTQDTGASWILSGYDQYGREVLNTEGAHAVIRGIWKGTMSLDSDGLQGLYISDEMREKIQAELMEGLIQEGLDMGLNEWDAKGRMYDVWYGDKKVPGSIGLGEILWDDRISYNPSEKYYQLNTTYVIGPDGKPWATNVTRDNLQTLFGFAPLNRYMVGDMVEQLDGKLNTTDSLSGVNTGLRGLVKTDETWRIPTDDEIAKRTEEAITKAIDKAYSANTSGDGDGEGGYGDGYGYSRRGGYSRGGGSYGGGSYAYRINPPERMNPIYANKDPYIRMDSPIIRRADIRRERYSSTRGRLNQWQ